MTTPSLEDRIAAQIRNNGPLSVAEYMALCLADPKDGYYMSAPPFGRDGDFITAPEVSQMFGELIGIWCLQAWLDMGQPAKIQLVELGPGRGTLMADLLRVAGSQPAFAQALNVHMVETSPRLREAQKAALDGAPCPISWHDHINDVPDGPLIVIANEFFDALPIHQYVRDKGAWRERVVGLNPEGDALQFGIGAGGLDEGELPASLKNTSEGAILETQPLGNAIAADIATRIAESDGAALFIDYGYVKSAPGDTVQALKRHEYTDVLQNCGAVDLTAHVNFEALARAATQSGVAAHGPMTQGDFLLALGLLERAGTLGSGQETSVQERLRADVERLAAPEQMGTLFKVLALTPVGRRIKPFDS